MGKAAETAARLGFGGKRITQVDALIATQNTPEG